MVERTKNAWGDPKPLVGRAGYAVWSSPWMVAGPDTFIHSVMAHWGIEMPWAIQIPKRATPPSLKRQTWVSASACWLLPSETFPFKGKHLRGFEENHPDKRFKLVDGEAFSWYGSRMLHVTAHPTDSSVGGETRLSGFATACQAANAKHDALVIKLHHELTGCPAKFTEGKLAPGLV